MARIFPARFAGTCQNCRGKIAAGEQIKRAARRGYTHAECETAERGYRGHCEDAPCCGCCDPYGTRETAYIIYG